MPAGNLYSELVVANGPAAVASGAVCAAASAGNNTAEKTEHRNGTHERGRMEDLQEGREYIPAGSAVSAADPEVHAVATTTHGRVLLRQSRRDSSHGTLVGFHGYMENAAIQLGRLESVPGADGWTLLSVQALHRFYRGRSQEIAASWMTREDRDEAIADNIAYVSSCV